MNHSLFAMLLLMQVVFLSCETRQNKAPSSPEEQNTLTKGELEKGWKLLFDGKTFNGWRGLGMEAVQEEHWKIEDGTIRKLGYEDIPSMPDGQPMEGSDLITVNSFQNFELYFEWKISKAGNSGLKYNVSEEMSQKYGGKYSALGFEYQLLDDEDTSYVGKIGASQFTGALYDMIPPKNAQIKPAGEFNSSRISINGNHVEHWLNGRKIIAYEFGSERLDSLYQRSKYRDYPHFLEKRKGHLVLQNHHDDIWFRNIKIREIDKNLK
ncbi:DUF1080 domain-containing protein [Fulvivirgaceae bacterium BMA10]|uniref:DUF1080 domain-containing protein n=1 Tax=Splendidivirga corallicola TaxID=3051826 RepID=A0ABT8KSD7_9BACT|nr:DUF1080 domain-containing protein [Fulvivirgaceae bacterium BMA10]